MRSASPSTTRPVETELFEVPDDWWRFKKCQVCGGNLFDGRTHTHTYAMQRQGWVKIGTSSNPAERCSVLGMQCPGARVRAPEGMDWAEPIVLLGVIEGDIEHQLHERFADAHAHGEWFMPHAPMREWLASGVLLTLAQAGLPITRVRKPYVPRPPLISTGEVASLF